MLDPFIVIPLKSLVVEVLEKLLKSYIEKYLSDKKIGNTV